MITPQVFTGAQWEGQSPALKARIVDQDGTNLVQADVSSIAYQMFDAADTTDKTVTSNGTISVATVIFDTLQTDEVWTATDTGYNFRWIAPGAELAGVITYRVEVTLTLAVGGTVPMVFSVAGSDLWGVT